MRVLVADDDVSIRRLLTSMLAEWGHEVTAAADGTEAWRILAQADGPPAAVLDWTMPGLSGTEVIRNARSIARAYKPYLLLLTAKDRQNDIVEGLRAGASDYIIKPFDYDELHARLDVGTQMVGLQIEMAQRVSELEQALQHVTHLQGLLPICAYCKKIRDDQNYWHAVENYIAANADVHFSHGICPECYENVARPEVDRIRGRTGGS